MAGAIPVMSEDVTVSETHFTEDPLRMNPLEAIKKFTIKWERDIDFGMQKYFERAPYSRAVRRRR